MGVFLLAYVKLIEADAPRAQYEVAPYISHIFRVATLFLSAAAVLATLFLLAMKNRLHLLKRVFRWLVAQNWAAIVLVRVPLTSAVFFAVTYLYLTFKMNLSSIAPFAWDGPLADLDRMLFFGTDPWVLSHSLMPAPLASGLMDITYILWFLELKLGMFAISLLPLRSRLRLTFLTAYCLNWLVAGFVIAAAFSSVGPVYMERLTGDSTFQPLMERLYEQSASITISALSAQEWLWEGHLAGSSTGGGVSAFPSLHVGFATTFACVGFAVSRGLGIALAAFAVLNFVASVHLGWHYAIDGIAGAALAVAFWLIAGRISDRCLALAGQQEVRRAIPDGEEARLWRAPERRTPATPPPAFRSPSR